MSLYFKIGGTWTPVTRPYVKRNGVWTPVMQTWRKQSGAWVEYFEWDVTPPTPPTLSLDLVPNKNGRHIKVGIANPGGNNSNIKMVRLLYSSTGYPATQFGGNYSSAREAAYPNEPWSDWYYNGYSGSPRATTNDFTYKTFPSNSDDNSKIAAGVHYFQAWALDINGNWSSGNYLQINVPKEGLGNNVIARDARFNPHTSGTWTQGVGFTPGDLTQSANPRVQYGVYFYGSDFTAQIGTYYGASHATITNAQIYLSRQNDEGAATANIWLMRHNYTNTGALPNPATTSFNGGEITMIGTLAKGESKWMSIPASFYADILNGTARGFAFFYKNPLNASANAADYSVLNGETETRVNAGQLYVVWTESP